MGLGIHGPKEVHDRHRETEGRMRTSDKVFDAARLLHRHRVPFNAFTCVSRAGAWRPVGVYRYQGEEEGSRYPQFIPIVEYRASRGLRRAGGTPARFRRRASPKPGPAGVPRPLRHRLISGPRRHGCFLCRAIDWWLKVDAVKVLVSCFETLISQHLGRGPQMRADGEICCNVLAVEHDGGVNSCDHRVCRDYRLGNVREGRLGRMAFSRIRVWFGCARSEALPRYFRRCPYLTDSWGECPKSGLALAPDGEPGLNYLCRGLRARCARALPEIGGIAASPRKGPLGPRERM